MAKHKCPIEECPKHKQPISRIHNIKRHFRDKHGMELEDWLKDNYKGGVEAWYKENNLELPAKENQPDPLENLVLLSDDILIEDSQEAMTEGQKRDMIDKVKKVASEQGFEIAISDDMIEKLITGEASEDEKREALKELGLIKDIPEDTPEEVTQTHEESKEVKEEVATESSESQPEEKEGESEEIDLNEVMTSDPLFIALVGFMALLFIILGYMAWKRHKKTGKVF